MHPRLRLLTLALFLPLVLCDVNKSITLELKNFGGYMWYTSIGIGSPAVLFNVTIDTGSSNLIVPSAGCASCPPPVFYNSSRSSTATPEDCNTKSFKCATCYHGGCASSVDYGGSIEEDFTLVSDVATIGGVHVRTVLGAVYNISMGTASSLARRHALLVGDESYPEGMLGLGFPALVDARSGTLFDSLVKETGLDDLFSFSLSETGGVLRLGGRLAPPTPATMRSALVAPPRFYTLHMTDFLVAGATVGLPSTIYNVQGAGCIVDTGTSVPSIPTKAFAVLRHRLMDTCGGDAPLPGVCGVPSNATLLDGQCFRLTDAQRHSFPTLTFVVDGAKLEYPPTSYLTNQYFCQHADTVGLALTPDPRFTVLGATLLSRYDVTISRTAHMHNPGFVDFTLKE